MKKTYQLISIAGLGIITMLLLAVIFAKYYRFDDSPLADIGNKTENSHPQNTESVENDAIVDSTEVVAGTESEDSTEVAGSTEMQEGTEIADSTEVENNTEVVNDTNDTTDSETVTDSQPQGDRPLGAPTYPANETPATINAMFVPSDITYFDDALFIGDSRTVGIREYGSLNNASYFVLEGLSIHNLWKKEVSVDGLGKVGLETLFNNKDYGKIYIMLGFNELGYDKDYSAKKYKEALDKIHQMEPNTIIYICSNLHLTERQAELDERFSSANMEIYNQKIRAFADQQTFFYLDVNEKFNDAYYNLDKNYSSDNVHLYAKYYKEWSDWFIENTVPR